MFKFVITIKVNFSVIFNGIVSRTYPLSAFKFDIFQAKDSVETNINNNRNIIIKYGISENW